VEHASAAQASDHFPLFSEIATAAAPTRDL
jgi:hypothetical protein